MGWLSDEAMKYARPNNLLLTCSSSSTRNPQAFWDRVHLNLRSFPHHFSSLLSIGGPNLSLVSRRQWDWRTLLSRWPALVRLFCCWGATWSNRRRFSGGMSSISEGGSKKKLLLLPSNDDFLSVPIIIALSILEQKSFSVDWLSYDNESAWIMEDILLSMVDCVEGIILSSWSGQTCRCHQDFCQEVSLLLISTLIYT